MTWLVDWNGREYDVDPTEMTVLELSLIKQRTGLSFKGLIEGVGDLDTDAIRSLFWTIDRRTDQELKFSEYSGPPIRIVLQALDGFNAAMEVMIPEGKAPSPTPTSTNGSPSSPASSDGPDPSTTDTPSATG